jgi:hypothetical protein
VSAFAAWVFHVWFKSRMQTLAWLPRALEPPPLLGVWRLLPWLGLSPCVNSGRLSRPHWTSPKPVCHRAAHCHPIWTPTKALGTQRDIVAPPRPMQTSPPNSKAPVWTALPPAVCLSYPW